MKHMVIYTYREPAREWLIGGKVALDTTPFFQKLLVQSLSWSFMAWITQLASCKHKLPLPESHTTPWKDTNDLNMSPFVSTWFALPAAFAVVHSWPPGCCVPWLSMTPPGPASLVASSPLHLGSMKRLIERGTSLDRSDRCSRCYWNQKLFDLSPIHYPESSSNSDKDDSRIIPKGYKSLITTTHDLTPEVTGIPRILGSLTKGTHSAYMIYIVGESLVRMHRSLAYLLYFVLSSNPAALRLLKNDMHDDVCIYIYL